LNAIAALYMNGSIVGSRLSNLNCFDSMLLGQGFFGRAAARLGTTGAATTTAFTT
jgi:hypothetical protein